MSLLRFDGRRKAIRAFNPDQLILHKLEIERIMPSRDLFAVFFSSKLATISSCPPVPDKMETVH